VGAERRDLKTPPRVPGGQDARRKLGI
jgi:hypothetical protein